MAAPLIGRHSQAPVLKQVVCWVRHCVGHAPFRSRLRMLYSARCTHKSDRMESLASRRALVRSRHLRLHPDIRPHEGRSRDGSTDYRLRGLIYYLRGSIAKIGTIQPHPVQDDSKLTRHSDDRTSMTLGFH